MKAMPPGLADALAPLRPALLTLAAAGSISLAVLGTALHVRGTAAEHLDQVRADAARIQGELARMREERRRRETDLRHYRAAEQAGVLGEERRLDWIERLRTLRDEYRLAPLDYRIEPQRPLSPPLHHGGFEARASRMHLKLGVRHEDELQRVLKGLADGKLGLFAVQACDVTRDAATAGGSSARLLAECSLDWFSIVRSDHAAPAPAR